MNCNGENLCDYGGTSGIGKCTAEAMAQKGYTVYELSRREEGLPGMFHIPTDVTDPDACQRAIDEVVSQAGAYRRDDQQRRLRDLGRDRVYAGRAGEAAVRRELFRHGEHELRCDSRHARAEKRADCEPQLGRRRDSDSVPGVLLGKQGGNQLLHDGAGKRDQALRRAGLLRPAGRYPDRLYGGAAEKSLWATIFTAAESRARSLVWKKTSGPA